MEWETVSSRLYSNYTGEEEESLVRVLYDPMSIFRPGKSSLWLHAPLRFHGNEAGPPTLLYPGLYIHDHALNYTYNVLQVK